jgi:hypothetical protein
MTGFFSLAVLLTGISCSRHAVLWYFALFVRPQCGYRSGADFLLQITAL